MIDIDEFHELLNEVCDELPEDFFRELHQGVILEEGVKKRLFNVKDLDLAAMALIMAVKGIEDYVFRTNDAVEFTSRIDQLIDLILHGIII
jgi:hypothetical protein